MPDLHLHRIFFYLWVCCLLVIPPAVVSGAETNVSGNPSPSVVLFISKSIRPYIEAADGFREALNSNSDIRLEVFELERFNTNSRSELADRLSKRTDLLVAVGPEAAGFIWNTPAFSDIPKLYCIILNPGKIIDSDGVVCGISLNIPPQYQLKIISSGLPAVRRVGLFFDPKQNTRFFEAALKIAPLLNIELVPLAVGSKKEIPDILARNTDLDCIWLIPDRTVVSESVVQYIIKQAVLQNIPVVGYNQFFYESGAAMAFVFDYSALGRQAADLAREVLAKHSCEPRIPKFQVWLNQSVIDKLGITVSASAIPQARFGP